MIKKKIIKFSNFKYIKKKVFIFGLLVGIRFFHISMTKSHVFVVPNRVDLFPHYLEAFNKVIPNNIINKNFVYYPLLINAYHDYDKDTIRTDIEVSKKACVNFAFLCDKNFNKENNIEERVINNISDRYDLVYYLDFNIENINELGNLIWIASFLRNLVMYVYYYNIVELTDLEIESLSEFYNRRLIFFRKNKEDLWRITTEIWIVYDIIRWKIKKLIKNCFSYVVLYNMLRIDGKYGIKLKNLKKVFLDLDLIVSDSICNSIWKQFLEKNIFNIKCEYNVRLLLFNYSDYYLIIVFDEYGEVFYRKWNLNNFKEISNFVNDYKIFFFKENSDEFSITNYRKKVINRKRRLLFNFYYNKVNDFQPYYLYEDDFEDYQDDIQASRETLEVYAKKLVKRRREPVYGYHLDDTQLVYDIDENEEKKQYFDLIEKERRKIGKKKYFR